jgi:hypothetical protein
MTSTTQIPTNQLLSVTSNTNINNNKGKGYANSTQFLKKKYDEKIEAKTIPGYDRAKRNEGGVGKAISLVETYWLLTGRDIEEENRTLTMVNLLANQKGQLLTDRETIYWLQEKAPYVAGTKFNAGKVLDAMMDVGIIKEYSKSYHTKGLAREALIKEKRGLSSDIVNIVRFYIDNHLEDLIDEIQDAATPRHKQTSRKIDMEKIWDAAWEVSRNPSLTRRVWSSIGIITKFKRRQRKEGITVSLIQDEVDAISPGFQPARKRHAVKLLADHYNLNPQTIKEALEEMEKEEKYVEEQVALLEELEQQVKEGTLEGNLTLEEAEESYPRALTDVDGTTSVNAHDTSLSIETLPSTDTSSLEDELHPKEVPPLLSSDSIQYLEEILPTASKAHLLSVDDIYDPSTIHSIKDLNKACAALRSKASTVMADEASLRVSAYNQAIAANILRYTPYDIVDVRQKEVMALEGALPTEYQLCSPNSPRVYGRGVDNLFYCRKQMRLAAFETLGFQDVDISGCHVHVALGLWGKHLPLLGQHVAKGSLWSHYETIYNAAGVPFYKSLMKAMHHATLLGGGVNAYREAHHSYNNHHPGAPITGDTLERIVGVFKSTDIYKELKALFNYLDKAYHNTSLTVLTGETFHVKGYRRRKDKKTGKVYADEGNLLTVISAILQSFEVSMLSYLILRANQLFVPVLWQHDGLTIKALYSNTVELMQEVLDEFTVPLLKRSFRLETTTL